MFFVGNDKAKICKGQKDSRAGAEHDFELTAADLVPGLQPFILAEFAMIDTHIAAKMTLQSPDDLRCQCDLGQEVERLPALTDRRFDLPDIDLCLATGRHAVEQADLSFAEVLVDGVICGLLRGG